MNTKAKYLLYLICFLGTFLIYYTIEQYSVSQNQEVLETLSVETKKADASENIEE